MSQVMFYRCSDVQANLWFARAYTVREFAKKVGCSVRTAYRYWDLAREDTRGIVGETKVFFTLARRVGGKVVRHG